GAAQSFGQHRYQGMLDAGIQVCLGTDSIVNLDTPDRISVLDEMRLLHRRDATDAQTLLRMATVHGASAMGLGEGGFTLSRQSVPRGLLSVLVEKNTANPWGEVMGTDYAPRWVFAPRNTLLGG
ncbi:MAG: amidohydrolase family protein, partial [Phycisphaerales bacterium]|nr:amidohydrolase family protein [Phycisphaerales bacterium]